MNPKEYLQQLLAFYNLCSGYQFSQVHNTDNGHHYKVTTGKNEITPLRPYNLGFIVGKCCWVTKARAQINRAILVDVLDDINDVFLLSLKHSGKYLHIYLYDRFGQVITYHKMKYASLNWWKFNPKKRFYNSDKLIKNVSGEMVKQTKIISEEEMQKEKDEAAKISNISEQLNKDAIVKAKQTEAKNNEKSEK